MAMGFPRIYSTPLRQHCVGAPKVFEVQELARGPLSPCQVWYGSDFICRRGGQKCCVFFCLCVCHVCDMMLVNDWLVNDGICAHSFALKALEYRNNFDTVG